LVIRQLGEQSLGCRLFTSSLTTGASEQVNTARMLG
jgi:hypothetical protein